MAEVEPPTKKAKTDEENGAEQTEEKVAVAAEPEPPKELETDAKPDKTDRIKDKVWFNVQDTTMNLMPVPTGGLLKSLTEGGLQYFLAGARANAGVKSGRYMFEVKIVEHTQPAEDYNSYSRDRGPAQLLKIGFSTSGNIPGEDECSVCFDSSGNFSHNKKRSVAFPAANRLVRDSVAAVVLNLDKKSENYNTVSIFCDGQRLSQPQPLPESLQGKELFPVVAFKNMLVHVNFGAEPLAPLPFKCRMLSDASAKDVTVSKEAAPTGGKHEVVVPVGLPDEGAFMWLDMFLQKNPGYTELSDRAILAWAEKSGLNRNGGFAMRACNDKPEMNFNIQNIDDGSVVRMIKTIAPIQNRNYVVMELKSNLIKDERKLLLSKFSNTMFKKVAQVQVGEPSLEFKKKVQEITLAEKQAESDREFRHKQDQERRKKMLEKQLKDGERAKRKAEKETKRKAAEMVKKLEADKKAAEKAAAEKAAQEAKEKAAAEKAAAAAAAVAAGGDAAAVVEADEKKEEPAEEKADEKMEEKEAAPVEEIVESESEAEEVEEEVKDEDPPKVELTAEEKKMWHIKTSKPDLLPYVLAANFAAFSSPEKDEGFDDIRYDWTKSIKCQEYMKNWVLEKKLTTRVEDLKPGAWFHGKRTEWLKLFSQWQGKQHEYRSRVSKRESEKAAKKAAVAAVAKAKEAAAAAKEAAAKEAAAAKAAAIAAGEEAKEDEPKEEAKEETKEEEAPMEEVEEEDTKVDFDGLDVFGVEDVMDIGGGMPLFKDFHFDDWTLLTLRFELHLLTHAFRRDVDDLERLGIHMDHFSFYYNRYFNKYLNAKTFGVETFKEVVGLVWDTLHVSKQQVLESKLADEMECLHIFIKLAEEERRERAINIDLGVENAKLNFNFQAGNKGGGKYDCKGGKRDGYGQGKDAGYGYGGNAWANQGKDFGGKGGKDFGGKAGGKDFGGKDWGCGGKDYGGGKDFGAKGGKDFGGKDFGAKGGKDFGGKDFGAKGGFGGKDAYPQQNQQYGQKGGGDQWGAQKGGGDQWGAQKGGGDQWGAQKGGGDQWGAQKGGGDQWGAQKGGGDQWGAQKGGDQYGQKGGGDKGGAQQYNQGYQQKGGDKGSDKGAQQYGQGYQQQGQKGDQYGQGQQQGQKGGDKGGYQAYGQKGGGDKGGSQPYGDKGGNAGGNSWGGKGW